ncbi:hypothetical protein SUGI_0293120 [Cryptomeria japonica]|nr:hypothetical protein SUGI_0293120 [Cryptomeria japonica]
MAFVTDGFAISEWNGTGNGKRERRRRKKIDASIDMKRIDESTTLTLALCILIVFYCSTLGWSWFLPLLPIASQMLHLQNPTKLLMQDFLASVLYRTAIVAMARLEEEFR